MTFFFIPKKTDPSIRLGFPSELTATVPIRAKREKRAKSAYRRVNSQELEGAKSCPWQAVLAPALHSPSHTLPGASAAHLFGLASAPYAPEHPTKREKLQKIISNRIQLLINSFGQGEKSMRMETPALSLDLQNICEQAYVCVYIHKTAMISEVCTVKEKSKRWQVTCPLPSSVKISSSKGFSGDLEA